MTTTDRATDQWVRRLTQGGVPTTRLVALPHAGGSASFFLPLAQALGPDVEVLGIQYPGRQDRHTEKMIDNVPELVEEIHPRITTWTDLPLVLFGHSMGAVLAFELARLLEQAPSSSMAGLIVSGRRAPSIRREDDNVHRLDDQGLIAEIRSLNGTDAAFLDDDELVRMILPVVRNDYKAIETYRYRPGPALRCPVHVLTGDADPRVSVNEARAWRDHTDGAFQFRIFTGGHFYLTTHAPEVAKVISGTVDEFAAGYRV